MVREKEAYDIIKEGGKLMIEIKEACKIALTKVRESNPDYELTNCTDIGDCYAFSYTVDGQQTIGIPYILVDKATGDIGWLGIPPIENLHKLKAGTKIDISNIDI